MRGEALSFFGSSRGVMGPDEDHSMVDNNGFTNAAAQLAIR